MKLILGEDLVDCIIVFASPCLLTSYIYDFLALYTVEIKSLNEVFLINNMAIFLE